VHGFGPVALAAEPQGQQPAEPPIVIDDEYPDLPLHDFTRRLWRAWRSHRRRGKKTGAKSAGRNTPGGGAEEGLGGIERAPRCRSFPGARRELLPVTADLCFSRPGNGDRSP